MENEKMIVYKYKVLVDKFEIMIDAENVEVQT